MAGLAARPTAELAAGVSAELAVARWWTEPYAAPFVRPLRTARGSWTVRHGAFVVAEAAGLRGFGEAGRRDNAPVDALAGAAGERPTDPVVAAALEQALLDLQARRAGVSLAALLASGRAPLARVAVNALIAEQDPIAAAAEARRCLARGFGVLKLKLAGTLEEDVALVGAVRAAVGPDVALRLDPNAAWEPQEAAARLVALAGLGVAYVEDPLPEPWRLAAPACPVAVDDAAHTPAGLAAALAGGVKHVVLKPLWAGGLLAARDACERARAAGASVVLTSCLDRGVASAGALHLAAALRLEAAQGLATAELFGAGWLAPVGGELWVPAGAGIGFAPPALPGRRP